MHGLIYRRCGLLVLLRVLACLALMSAPWASAQNAITLGAEDDAAPWSAADGTGYVNDLVRLAFEAAGWQVTLKVMPYARCKSLTIKGELAGCFSTSQTPALRNALLYPRYPVFAARNVLLARSGGMPAGCDLAQWPRPPRIGTVRQYEYRPAVEQLFATGRAIRDDTDSEMSSLRKLQAGRIDAALVTIDEVKRIESLQAQAQITARFDTLCDFGSEPAFVAFSPRHALGPAALKAFEQGFAQLQTRGELPRLQQVWRARMWQGVGAKPSSR